MSCAHVNRRGMQGRGITGIFFDVFFVKIMVYYFYATYFSSAYVVAGYDINRRCRRERRWIIFFVR